jgi:hypothetical protein
LSIKAVYSKILNYQSAIQRFLRHYGVINVSLHSYSLAFLLVNASDFLFTCSSFQLSHCAVISESLALLQFKQSFEINVSDSHNPFAYPKVSSWNSGKNNDCCSWDGVLCDGGTGHVIGLDLSSSYLYGPSTLAAAFSTLFTFKSSISLTITSKILKSPQVSGTSQT